MDSARFGNLVVSNKRQSLVLVLIVKKGILRAEPGCEERSYSRGCATKS